MTLQQLNKDSCKQCVADFGLDWCNRQDLTKYWSNSGHWWSRANLMPCPVVYTYAKGIPADGDLASTKHLPLHGVLMDLIIELEVS